jgi:hypothetical protein
MTRGRGGRVCRVWGGERKRGRDVCVCVCEVEGGERKWGRDVCVCVCEDFVSLRVDRLLR